MKSQAFPGSRGATSIGAPSRLRACFGIRWEAALRSEGRMTGDKAKPIPGSIGELFDASGGLRAATLRAGRFWPPGSSPISSVLPGTDFDRLLPDRPKAVGAAPIQFRNRLL